MWWCCGKKGKDQKGCKVSKHEYKDDDDDDEHEEKKKEKEMRMKYQKCMCCKELGHKIEDCHRDPNFKTKLDPKEEAERIMEIKESKTIFAETVIRTTHFLKKCAKVAKVYEHELEKPEQQAKATLQLLKNENVFNRGAMHFEDYNYDHFNKHILIDPNKEDDDEYQETEQEPVKGKASHLDSEEDSLEGKPVGYRAPPEGFNKMDDGSEKRSAQLTEKLLDNFVNEEFQHENLTVMTESEKQEAALKAQEQVKKEIQERKANEAKKRQEEQDEQDQDDDDGSGDEQNRHGKEETPDDYDDDVEYEIFYNQKEIKKALKEQKKNVFRDIMNEKQFLVVKHKGLEGLKELNKYKIEDYFPES